jgi:diguanylate cyclase (GGDEF)-like protein
MGIMLLPLIVLAAGAFSSFQSVIRAFDQVVQNDSVEMNLAAHLQVLIRRMKIVARDSLIPGFGNEDDRATFLEASRQVDKAFQEARAEVFDQEEERTLIQSAHADWQRGRSIGDTLLAIPNPARNPRAGRQLERLDALLDRALDKLERVHSLAMGEMGRHLEQARGVRQRALLVMVVVFVVGLGTALLVGMALARSVLLPLRVLEEAANRFGSGDLSHRVSLTTPNEMGELGKTFNAMADRLAKAQAELEDLSIHDGLTGLFNFREFHRQLAEEVERSWRYGHPLSLLMLDIDHFKSVNDTFGHLAGDDALRALATRIRQEVRPADRIARYGGEELVIILPETRASGAMTMAERLREIIASHPIPLGPGQTVTLTVSIGVAAYPEDVDSAEGLADSAEQLIRASDKALYAAKEAGRNRVCRFGKT